MLVFHFLSTKKYCGILKYQKPIDVGAGIQLHISFVCLSLRWTSLITVHYSLYVNDIEYHSSSSFCYLLRLETRFIGQKPVSDVFRTGISAMRIKHQILLWIPREKRVGKSRITFGNNHSNLLKLFKVKKYLKYFHNKLF